MTPSFKPWMARPSAFARLRERMPDAFAAGLKYSCIFLLALVLASAAIALTRDAGRIAAVWPVNAVLFVLLLKHRRHEWRHLLTLVGAGLLTANLMAGDTVSSAILFASANVVEICLAAVIFSAGTRPRLVSPRGVIRLFLASIVACVVSAGIVAIGNAALGTNIRAQDIALWLVADCLGYFLFVPTLWSVVDRSSRYFDQKDSLETALQFVSLSAVCLLVFAQTKFPFLFLVAPVLVWMAFSGGVRRAALGMLVVTAISLPLSLNERGPVSLVQAGEVTRIIVLQLFLVTNSMLSISVGAIMAERRRLHAHLARSKSRLTSVTSHQKDLLAKSVLSERMSGIGHWSLDFETSKVFWSPQVYAIHGVYPLWFNPEYSKAVSFYTDEDRPRIQALIDNGLRTGNGWEFEASIVRHSDGANRRVRSLAHCVQDKLGRTSRVVGVFQDITEQSRVLQELSEREREYRLLANHSTDIIVKFGMDGRIEYVSPSGQTLGVSPEEAIGRRIIDFAIEEDREHAGNLTAELFDGSEPNKSVRREFRVRNASGQIICLEGNPRIIRDSDGRPTSVVSAFRDVTERRNREAALAAAKLTAETATKAKAEFLSNMSHEIRTPLNGVLGFTELIRQTGLSEEQSHFVDRIAGAGRMLRVIVDDILDFSKIEAGKMEIESKPLDAGAVVLEVIDLVDAGRIDKSVLFTHSLCPEADLNIMGDEIRLRQILANIIGNAAKFTKAGSIYVSAEVLGKEIEVRIKDTGAGIPADKIESIFEGFQQADSTVTRRFGGTGLGLSISRSLARLMGGDIHIESREGEGTLVRVRLPYVRASAGSGSSQIDDACATQDPSKCHAARVMVVDDVEMNLELMKVGLTQAGYDVTTFNSAESAITSLKAGDLYDVILMDVQMPFLDGPSATKIIRTLSDPCGRIPVVALTAHALDSEVSTFLAAGMTAHFSKPINLAKLDQYLQNLLSGTSARMRQKNPDHTDPVSGLREEYRIYLSTVSDHIVEILKMTSDQEVLGAVRSLAHAIAGTAGSLGFSEVSDVAFELEDSVRRLRRSDDSVSDIKPELEKFVDTVARACA